MSGEQRVSWAAGLALAAALGAWYAAAARAYPYYVLWDMDLVATQDVLAIGSGELPDHVAHPGFGAFLVWHLTTQAAAARGELGAASYEALAAAPDPLLPAAELTDFLRAQSPWAALAIPLALALALIVTCRAPPAVGVVVLASLAVQLSLLYHASLVRSGTFAAAYWAGGLALLSLAAARPRARTPLALTAGVLLGLALQTKLQAALLLAAAPVWFGLALAAAPDARWGGPPARPRLALGVAIGTAGCGGALLLAAAAFTMPAGLATWTETYTLGPVGWGALLGLAAVVGLAAWAQRRPDHPLGWFALRWAWVCAGIAASFALHLVLYASPAQGWTHLLVDTKLVFLRGGDALGETALSDRVGGALNAIGAAPFAWGGAACLLGAAVWGQAHGWLRLRRSELALWLAWAGLTLVVLGSTRFVLRDLLWEQSLLHVGFVGLALQLARRSRGPWRRPVAGGAGLLVAGLLLSGWGASREVEARVLANYNLYGWRLDEWTRGQFKRTHPRYTEIVRSRAGAELDVATRRAIDWRRWLQRARSALPNQPHTTADLGLLRAGWAVWRDSPRRLREVPRSLRDAASVDCVTRPLAAHGRLIPRTGEGFNERREKRRAPAVTDRLALLARSDQRLLVFVAPARAAGLLAAAQGQLRRAPETLRVDPAEADPGERVGLEVVGYAEVPREALGPRPLIVIAPR